MFSRSGEEKKMALGQQTRPAQPNIPPVTPASQPQQQQQTPPVPAAATAQAAIQPAAQPTTAQSRANGVPSIISADLTIKGTLVTERDVQLDGRVEGDIRAASLVLGEKALVQGDIYAEEAIIRGRVEGSIRARKVTLTTTAHVEGNIVHDRQLSVEAGAYFEGNCRHAENPMKDAGGESGRKNLGAVAAE
jgi:cytoskeletal protein CcmA (bactofilin family)